MSLVVTTLQNSRILGRACAREARSHILWTIQGIGAYIGSVAYRLELPPGTNRHDVFHVSLLKKFHGDPLAKTSSLPRVEDGKVIMQPAKILGVSLRRDVKHVLVQWEGTAEDDR